MTKYDLDLSLKQLFMMLHVLFLTGAAFYVGTSQNQYAIFFAISSVLSLLYYVIYQTGHIQTRVQAHLNLIEEAVKNSEEFKQKVEKASDDNHKEEKKQEETKGKKEEETEGKENE